MIAWLKSWLGVGEPVDAAPSSPALYVAGPVSVEREGEGYRVTQACGIDSRGAPVARAWSFTSADALKKQIEEFGGASTAPELRAALESAGELVEPAPPVELDAGKV